jgi:hypothetical protein
MNNFKKFLKNLTVLRVSYAIFWENLALIREYSSCRPFLKFDQGKITNTALKK